MERKHQKTIHSGQHFRPYRPMTSFSRRQLLHHLTIGGSATIAAAAFTPHLSAQPLSQPSPALDTIKPQTWKLTSVWDPDSLFGRSLQRFVEQVGQQTQGLLELKLVTPPDPREALNQVSKGQVEMGQGLPLLWENQLPAAPYLMTIPFGLTATEQWLWLYQGGGQALADQVYATVGCKYFPGGNLGFTAGGWFKAEVTGVNALAEITLQSSGLAAAVWQALGAKVVTLAPAQMRQQLREGTIGAAEYVSPQQDLQIELHQAAPFYYFPGWQRPGTLLDFFINLEAWNSLSPWLQASLEAAIVSFNQWFLNEQTFQNQQALRSLLQQGIQIRSFPESVLLRLESITGELLQERSKTHPQVGEVLQSIIDFRANLLPWIQQVEVGYLTARRWTWKLR